MALNPADQDFATIVRAQLPIGAFGQSAQHYLEEPRRQFQGQAGLVMTPGTTADVAQIIKLCQAHRVGVVPYGGGTGLVGGQVMPKGPAPVILSLEKMNAIRETLPGENILIVEAGMILANVQQAAAKVERLFPLSLASEGSCQIGGNLATNAGGVNVLRYGNARDLCLGIEAVLPDGTILHGLSRLRKDNTGYDLRNLLIGAEGSLGVITAASLKLYARPVETVAGLLVVPGPAAALKLLGRAQGALGSSVSAFELIHRQGLEFIRETMPDMRLPFADLPEWMVLMDLGAGANAGLSGQLEGFLEGALEDGLIEDALISQNQAQRQAFWHMRESLPEANRLIGAICSHDISVPLGALPEFITRGAEIAAAFPGLRINCFGHMGDGNLHYNFFPPKGGDKQDYRDLRQPVKEAVYNLVSQLGGSISAEHGIGRLKINDLLHHGDPTKIRAMQMIKAALDPNGIMNPGAVVPA